MQCDTYFQLERTREEDDNRSLRLLAPLEQSNHLQAVDNTISLKFQPFISYAYAAYNTSKRNRIGRSFKRKYSEQTGTLVAGRCAYSNGFTLLEVPE